MRGKRHRSDRVRSDQPESREERDTRQTQREIEELAQVMVAVRKRAGMTQLELAEVIGTQRGAIARLESGRHAPSMRILQKFARVMDMQLNIGFTPNPPLPTKASHTMADTLTRPSAFPHTLANRRQFLGGAAGMVGILGLGNIRHISAQEATVAASAVADYVWTPPSYDPEPALFTVIDRTEKTVTVDTIDGQVEIPADPQRVISLGFEYVSIFEVGAADMLVAVAYNEYLEDPLFRAGDLTDEMQRSLADVTLIPNPWEVDIEHVLELDPDLIFASSLYTQDPSTLTQIAPTIRGTTHALSVPRAAVEDFGALLGRSDVAADAITQHEAFVGRARRAAAPFITGKKVVAISPVDETIYAYPSYYIENEGVFATINGAYQLHRELGATPSSFIEHLADEDNRRSDSIGLSLEQIGAIDADCIFVLDINDGKFDDFVNNPLVQQTVAAQHNAIFPYDYLGFGFGLAGVRAAVASIVETLTGEPFE